MKPAPKRPPCAPWNPTEGLRGLCFAVIWSTGADPAKDGVFRLSALRRNRETGSFERFDRLLRPFPETGPSEERRSEATRRMAAEFGVQSSKLVGAPELAEVRDAFERFLDGRPVVVPDADAFRMWFPGSTARAVDLARLANLLLPGRLAHHGPQLAAELAAGSTGENAPPTPDLLRRATAILVGRSLSRSLPALSLLAHAWTDLLPPLAAADDPAADELRLAAGLLEHPSLLRDEEELYPEHSALTDGQLSDAIRLHETLEDALEEITPPWSNAGDRETPPLSPAGDEPAPLDAVDRRHIDEIFQAHLPRVLAERDAARGRASTHAFRKGQHEVAARIAQSLGARELLLVHAPTGTGKTLAYLVPALLFAVRNGLRVGVATYTRALQEQAHERDVPLALSCLERIGAPTPRVSILKGRSNYLCWRALCNQVPAPDAPAAELFVWIALVLFATTDEAGDLDRLPLAAPLGWSGGEHEWRRRIEQLVRLVRADSGCCTGPVDRATCGAHAARRRAERAHLVVTNHAFALARREFFRFVVFDECEHLHDVAREAFSHVVSVQGLRDLLARAHRPGRRRSPGVLGALQGESLEESPVALSAAEGIDLVRRAGWALDAFSDALVGFEDWRAERARTRQERDGYGLFREFLGSGQAGDLLETHTRLARDLGDLEASLQRLAEHLDEPGGRGRARTRRSLELLRARLRESVEALTAWIPRAGGGLEGPASLGETAFHDLERNARGESVLATRVLLPHEQLGRHYYPDLCGAVFLSATTWLREGFDSASTYLGLARAAAPRPEEEREPSRLATFRAPEAFDYSRVLVAVPRDAPSVREDKSGLLRYTARFVAYLAERTRGRMLVLFTNAADLAEVAETVAPFFAERGLPFWYQRMRGSTKEELAERFRAHTDSVLFGLDTFWYGTDFPGTTLEYLVLVRLPYGVPDPYHRAQCAALGEGGQRREIYLPRALAKFRQGFGRLMRRETDRGCVFVLDKRILDPRHRMFLRELPLPRDAQSETEEAARHARLVSGDTDRCVREALAHMSMGADIRRRGLEQSFRGWTPDQPSTAGPPTFRGRSSPLLGIRPDEAPF